MIGSVWSSSATAAMSVLNLPTVAFDEDAVGNYGKSIWMLRKQLFLAHEMRSEKYSKK